MPSTDDGGNSNEVRGAQVGAADGVCPTNLELVILNLQERCQHFNAIWSRDVQHKCGKVDGEMGRILCVSRI